jgi:hypothetical protein
MELKQLEMEKIVSDITNTTFSIKQKNKQSQITKVSSHKIETKIHESSEKLSSIKLLIKHFNSSTSIS